MEGEGQLNHFQGRRVAILTFGCTANEADSAALEAVLSDRGAIIVQDPSTADSVVINTCAVVAATERRMLRVIRQYSRKDVHVTGCLPAARPGLLRGAGDPPIFPTALVREKYAALQRSRISPCAAVRIADGCCGSCTYCITRLAKGPVRSVPLDDVVAAVRRAAAAGIPEIRLTAQDCAAWGADTGSSLPVLLREVLAIPGPHRVRLGMMHPASVLPLLPELTALLQHERIFRFVHLPVQSGSDRILAAMQRGYQVADVVRIVSSLREADPDISIATDIICGYPGETETDVEATIGLIREMRFSRVNVTRYSRRPGTAAAALHDMPDRFKKDRSRRVGLAAAETVRAINAGWIGMTVPVLVTEQVREGSVMARTPSYQGVVMIGTYPPGTVGTARLCADQVHYFTGTFLPVS